MPCHWIKFKDADGIEHTAHVNMAKQRTKPCSVCGGRGDLLCDFPVTAGPRAGKDCDASLCVKCAVRRPQGKDYCPSHPVGPMKL